MKIAVLSDTRVPTRREGGHGLGRMAWDITEGLRQRRSGDGVVDLFAGPNSEAPAGVVLIAFADEMKRAEVFRSIQKDRQYDAIIDLSHHHDLSRVNPDLPVVNWIVDTECPWQPPNAVVGNAWQQQRFPKARIVPLGVPVAEIPFTLRGGGYLAYAAKIHATKGWDIAEAVDSRQPMRVRFVGERWVADALADWRPELRGAAFYEFIGGANALLSPCRRDAGGRVNLEAAACGTPVLCLDGTGTEYHVEHGVSGFVCANLDEMVEAVGDVQLLDRRKCREWVHDTHSLRQMIDGVEAALTAVAAGERW